MANKLIRILIATSDNGLTEDTVKAYLRAGLGADYRVDVLTEDLASLGSYLPPTDPASFIGLMAYADAPPTDPASFIGLMAYADARIRLCTGTVNVPSGGAGSPSMDLGTEMAYRAANDTLYLLKSTGKGDVADAAWNLFTHLRYDWSK